MGFRGAGEHDEIDALTRCLANEFRLDGLSLSVVTPNTADHFDYGSLSDRSRLPLGSFGKPVLATLIRRLTCPAERQAARLTWGRSRIPVDDLLCHTSGLTEFGSPSGTAGPLSAVAEPGRYYSYSGRAFDLAVRWFLRQRGTPDISTALLAAGLEMATTSRRRVTRCVANDLDASVADLRAFASAVASELLHPVRVEGSPLLSRVAATAELQTGSPWFWSDAGDLVLQHGGVTGEHAIILVAVPARRLVFLVVAAGLAAARAQVEAVERICQQLTISLRLPGEGGQRAPTFTGWFGHGADRYLARAAGGSLTLQRANGRVQHLAFLTPNAFAHPSEPVPNPRYAPSIICDADGAVTGFRLNERAFIRMRRLIADQSRRRLLRDTPRPAVGVPGLSPGGISGRHHG